MRFYSTLASTLLVSVSLLVCALFNRVTGMGREQKYPAINEPFLVQASRVSLLPGCGAPERLPL